MSWTWQNNRLTFHWREGTGIRENIADLIEGIHEAGQMSLQLSDTCRVVLPGYDEFGCVEARTNRQRRLPERPPVGMTTVSVISQAPYYLLQAPAPSVYYNIQIPGLLTLIDETILAINPEYANLMAVLCNEVFNHYITSTNVALCPPHLIPYVNMPRTLASITKKPRVPKLVNFTPIFVTLFGEKIATVIMKEIK